MINDLFTAILSRRGAAPETSYTARLFATGEDGVIKKVGEEAIEVILAAKGQGNTHLVEEVADLTYHILVPLTDRGLSPADVETELAKRIKYEIIVGTNPIMTFTRRNPVNSKSC